jgi:uncharacterized protein (TIGR03437 family)
MFRSTCLLLAVVSVQSALAQSAVPTIGQGGVVNAADNSGAVAPGALISIYGAGLASGSAVAPSTPLPTTLLDQVAVEVTDAAGMQKAPLWFVSAGQINAQLPYNLTGPAVQVRVRNSRGASNLQTVTLSRRAPRLFSRTMDGKGEALVFHANYTPVTAASPAVPGESVFAYANSMGAVTPDAVGGRAAGDGSAAAPLNLVSEYASVTVGGREGVVQFVGLAPYFVGVYQINFQVPDAPSESPAALTISLGDVATQAGISIAYRSNWRVVTDTSVAPAGGTVTGGGLTLTIPQGVLSAPTGIKLYRAAGNDSAQLGTPVATDLFAIEGLPETATGAMALGLDILSPGPDDNHYQVLWRRTGSGQPSLSVYSGRVVGNRILAQIGPPPVLTAAMQTKKPTADQVPQASPPREADGDKKLKMMLEAAADSGAWPSLTNRLFQVSGRRAADQIAATANAAFETAYFKLMALGLQWGARTVWPVQVHVYPFTWLYQEKDSWFGYLDPSKNGVDYYSININETRFQGPGGLDAARSETLRITAGHELFHLMQALYDGRPAATVATNPGAWYWFNEAASTWFERQMASNPNYVSTAVSPSDPLDKSDNYAFFIKHGLEYPDGDTREMQEHGYGASMFLEHLSSAYGNIIGAILPYKKAPVGDGFSYYPSEAIDQVLRQKGSTIGAEWRAFCKKYMAGDVYGGKPQFPPSNLIVGSLRAQRVRFTSFTDPPASFSWNANDLAAQLYLVHFDYDLAGGTKLNIQLTDGPGQAEAILFKFGAGGLWTSWASTVTAAKPLEYANAETQFKKGEGLAILIANGRAVRPYSGITPITLTVSTGSSLLDKLHKATEISFTLITESTKRYTQTPGLTTGTVTGQDNCYVHGGWGPPITWSSPTHFSVTGAPNSYLSTYRMEGDFDPTGNTLTSATFRQDQPLDKTTGTAYSELYEVLRLPNTGYTSYTFKGSDTASHVWIVRKTVTVLNGPYSRTYEYVSTNWGSTDTVPALSVVFQ